MIRRILHATDFSPASHAAFKKALELVKQNRAELVVLHVMSPVVYTAGEGYMSPKMYDELTASTRAWAKGQLDRQLRKAKAAGVRARGLLLEGLAHEQIVRAAKAQRTDLVVIGTHGRSGLAKFFIGSVAGRVVSAAHCPVLTVRGK
jgi:nucleotide-binding universal stress UspA family protein